MKDNFDELFLRRATILLVMNDKTQSIVIAEKKSHKMKTIYNFFFSKKVNQEKYIIDTDNSLHSRYWMIP